MYLAELPDVLRHLSHANGVRGGGLLFSRDLTPVLELEAFLDADAGARARRSKKVHVRKVGRVTITDADSAEAVRALKQAWGVPCRPVERN